MISNVQLFAFSGHLSTLAAVARISHGKQPFQYGDYYKEDGEKDFRLVKMCYDAKHMSVFEFASITYYVRTPIFVARQLMRYRCASYIERSLRCCDPISLESRDSNNFCDTAYIDALGRYEKLVESGVKKEEARRVLTLETPTEFLWQMNLRELFHVFDERLALSAQLETRNCVEQMYDIYTQTFKSLADIYERPVKASKNE